MTKMADQIVSLIQNPSDDRLVEFESRFGITLGWKCDVEFVLEAFAAILRDECDDGALSYAVEAGAVQIAYPGRSRRVRTRRNHRICFDLLRAFNDVLAGSYEIRSMVFRKEEVTFGTFVLAASDTWATAERLGDVSSQFETIGLKSGFSPDRYPWVVVLLLERLSITFSALLASIAAHAALRR